MSARRLAVLLALTSALGCGDGSEEAQPLGAGGAAGDAAAGAAGAAGSAAGGSGGTGNAAGTAGTGAIGGTAGSGGEAGAAGGGAGAAGSAAAELIAALGTSVWQGLQTRNGKQRAYELRFDAPSLLWAEIRNPFGPARHREMRAFEVDADGASVHSAVVSPAGWPVDPENGRKDDWTLQVVDGTPRKLQTTREGVLEEFTEGEWPAPTEGLTAEVHVFPPNGAVFDAFCGQSSFGNIDYATLWDAARGDSTEPELGFDVAAGVPLDRFTDPTGNNQYAVTDLPGFDRLGGTELSDQFDFVVRYQGTLAHPGGAFALREADDHVTDAVWAFLGAKIGSNYPSDLFLEVTGKVWADATPDEPSAVLPAQDLAVEILVLRCSTALADIDVEARFGSGAWQLVGSVATKPLVDDELFPPAL